MLDIYSKDNCPQCRTALAMVKSKGIEHRFLKLDTDYTKDELLKIAPGAKALPQIVVDGKHLGSLAELQKYLAAK